MASPKSSLASPKSSLASPKSVMTSPKLVLARLSSTEDAEKFGKIRNRAQSLPACAMCKVLQTRRKTVNFGSPQMLEQELMKAGDRRNSVCPKNGRRYSAVSLNVTSKFGMAKMQPVQTPDLPPLTASENSLRKDSGYAWVVLIAAFFCQLISLGVTYSVGVLTVAFLSEFKQGTYETAWVASINTGFSVGAGPLAAWLVTTFDHQTTVVIGGLLSTVGIALSTLATELWVLYITFGAMAGTGFCLVYLPSATIIPEYFHTKQTFAFGLITAGSGVGNLIMAPLLQLLLDNLSLTLTFFALAGICFLQMMLGLFLRPPPAEKSHSDGSYHGDTGSPPSVNIFTVSPADEEVADDQEYRVTSEYNERNTSHGDSDGEENSTAAIARTNPVTVISNDGNNNSDNCNNSNSNCNNSNSNNSNSNNSNSNNGSSYNCNIINNNDVSNDDNMNFLDVPSLTSSYSGNDFLSSKTNYAENEADTLRSSADLLHFIRQENRRRSGLCGLLSEWRTWVFAISSGSYQAGANCVFILISDFAMKSSAELSSTEGTVLITVIGVAMLIGEMLPSIIGYFIDDFGKLIPYAITPVIYGLVTILFPFMTSYETLIVGCFVFGMAFGAQMSLVLPLVSDIFGEDRLSHALGFSLLIQGIGLIGGPPLAGLLQEASGYTASFHAAGALILISVPAIMLLGIGSKTGSSDESQPKADQIA